jgi:hypothetical protein
VNPRRALRAFGLASLVGLATACAGSGPAPSPTEPPTTPSPLQPSPNANLVEFERHLRDATTREGQLVRDLAASATASNDRLDLVARQLAAWAAAERSWLDDNVADTCYEEAWQTYSSGVEDVMSAAEGFHSLAGRPSPRSDEEGQAAGASLSSGGDALRAAADLAMRARAACR